MQASRENNFAVVGTASVHAAVPPGAPSWVTPDLIAATLRTWQPHYEKSLTCDDALEILLSVAQVFEFLEEKDEQQSIPGAGPGQQP